MKDEVFSFTTCNMLREKSGSRASAQTQGITCWSRASRRSRASMATTTIDALCQAMRGKEGIEYDISEAMTNKVVLLPRRRGSFSITDRPLPAILIAGSQQETCASGFAACSSGQKH